MANKIYEFIKSILFGITVMFGTVFAIGIVGYAWALVCYIPVLIFYIIQYVVVGIFTFISYIIGGF